MDNRLPDVTVAAQNINTGQAVVFIVPLNGFAAALERHVRDYEVDVMNLQRASALAAPDGALAGSLANLQAVAQKPAT